MKPAYTTGFQSTKTFTHAEGLSCAFRQWKAKSHCQFLHGYALEVKVTFGSKNLDDRNWVMDFGGLKAFKEWLKETFDHKTLVAADDPLLMAFQNLNDLGVIQMVLVEAVGCEKFAEHVYNHLNEHLVGTVYVESVEVREHAGNSAICYRKEVK